jgi:hypothetical protein
MYLSKDDETCNDVYKDVEFNLIKDGVKPEDMPEGQCPACVAEHIQVKAEWLICDTAADMLDMDITGKELNSRLLCMGLDKYHEFIDLIVRLVVNLPDFKNPITGGKLCTQS